MRRARARRLAMVAAVAGPRWAADPAVPRGDQTHRGQASKPSAERVRSSDHQRVELALASVPAWTAERRVVSRAWSAARGPAARG
jgi:hypothetical protein